jgi:hypothetical protein
MGDGRTYDQACVPVGFIFEEMGTEIRRPEGEERAAPRQTSQKILFKPDRDARN